jgi:transposase
VIIDLTGIRDGTGPARLLDMVQGRSEQAFKTWLSQRPKDWRDGIEVVAMDGFTGFKTATTGELPDAVTVREMFHVVRLAGDALDRGRRRIQQIIHGHRGRKDDPPYLGPADPAHRCRPAYRQAEGPPARIVRGR